MSELSFVREGDRGSKHSDISECKSEVKYKKSLILWRDFFILQVLDDILYAAFARELESFADSTSFPTFQSSPRTCPFVSSQACTT